MGKIAILTKKNVSKDSNPLSICRYNLSSYPFLNSVPEGEDIDFKCDGLHDGFYASIKYSCQVCELNLK